MLFLSVLIAAPVGFFVNRSRKDRPAQSCLSHVARWWLGGLVVLIILFVIGFVATVSDNIAYVTGEASFLKVLGAVSYVLAALTPGAMGFTGLAWRNRYWGVSGRLHDTLVTLAAAAFIWFLNFWNLLGWRF